jgi:hypothetical protein
MKLSTPGFIIEVLCFLSSGFAFGRFDFYLGLFFLTMGFFAAYHTGRQMIKEAK